jgi:hypothetical protein
MEFEVLKKSQKYTFIQKVLGSNLRQGNNFFLR